MEFSILEMAKLVTYRFYKALLAISFVLSDVYLRYALRFGVRVADVVANPETFLTFFLRPQNSDGQCAPVSDLK